MPQTDNLKKLIIEAVKKSTDITLLDLISRLLIAEGRQ